MKRHPQEGRGSGLAEQRPHALMTSVALPVEVPGSAAAGAERPADRRGAQAAERPTRLNRVDALRTLAILAVVMLHFPPYPAGGEVAVGLGRWLLAAHSVLVDGLFYLAVPTLAFVSGYLSLATAHRLSYSDLLRRKARTVLVPLLVWNAVALALSALGQALGFFGDARFQIDQMGPMDVANALVGLTRNPVNFPLHFLRDLLVLFALWPLWKELVRHAPWLGLVAVLAVFSFNLDGDLIRRDAMAVTFYMGALFGGSRLKIERLDALAVPATLALGLLALLLSNEGASLLPPAASGALSGTSRVLAPLLVWAAASWLLTNALGRWLQDNSVYSFPVFLMHMPLMIIAWRVLKPVMEASPIAYVTCWLIVSALSVLVCVGISRVIHHRWPKLASWAYGGR